MQVAALEGSGNCRTLFVHAGGLRRSTQCMQHRICTACRSCQASRVAYHVRQLGTTEHHGRGSPFALRRQGPADHGCQHMWRCHCAGLKPSMLREAATLARQDLAGLRPEERVELLDRQLSGAPVPPAPATDKTQTESCQLSCGAGAWQPPQTLKSDCCVHPYGPVTC